MNEGGLPCPLARSSSQVLRRGPRTLRARGLVLLHGRLALQLLGVAHLLVAHRRRRRRVRGLVLLVARRFGMKFAARAAPRSATPSGASATSCPRQGCPGRSSSGGACCARMGLQLRTPWSLPIRPIAEGSTTSRARDRTRGGCAAGRRPPRKAGSRSKRSGPGRIPTAALRVTSTSKSLRRASRRRSSRSSSRAIRSSPRRCDRIPRSQFARSKTDE